jgi:DNA-binding NarL/FixJ family response regulator
MSTQHEEVSSKSRTIRIVLACSHPVLRFGLKALLESHSDLRVVAEADSGSALLKLAPRAQGDVLLLDPHLRDVQPLDLLRNLFGAQLRTRTILFTSEADSAFVRQALQLGVRGVLPKEATLDVVVKSVRCVVDGEYWVVREIVEDWLQSQHQPQSRPFGLTERELDIVREVTFGATNRNIAGRFSIEEVTVKRHLTNIFAKLGVSNRLELALFALAHNLASRP